MAAFKDLPANDRPESENNSDDCCDIQFGLRPVYLVCLVCLVYLVDLIHPVSFIQPNKPNKLNKPDRPESYLNPNSDSNSSTRSCLIAVDLDASSCLSISPAFP